MNEFKDMLKYLRKREGISQAELALRLGITPAAIGNYETGTRELPFELAITLAKFYNVSLDYMAGLTNNPTPTHKK